MVVILSRSSFVTDGELWRRQLDAPSARFSSDRGVKVPNSFQSRSVQQAAEEAADEASNEEVAFEDPVPVEAVALEEIEIEPQISMPASELDKRLAQSRRDGAMEAERSARQTEEQLRLEFDQKLGELSSRLDSNLGNQRQLLAALVGLALKIGEMLARTELKVSEDSVDRFIRGSLLVAQETNTKGYTLSVSPAWQPLLENSAFSRLNDVSLVFDPSLEIGDLKLVAGEGGFFDLISDRVEQINSQLRSGIGNSTLSSAGDALDQLIEPSQVDVFSSGEAPQTTQFEEEQNEIGEDYGRLGLEDPLSVQEQPEIQSGEIDRGDLLNSDQSESLTESMTNDFNNSEDLEAEPKSDPGDSAESEEDTP